MITEKNLRIKFTDEEIETIKKCYRIFKSMEVILEDIVPPLEWNITQLSSDHIVEQFWPRLSSFSDTLDGLEMLKDSPYWDIKYEEEV